MRRRSQQNIEAPAAYVQQSSFSEDGVYLHLYNGVDFKIQRHPHRKKVSFAINYVTGETYLNIPYKQELTSSFLKVAVDFLFSQNEFYEQARLDAQAQLDQVAFANFTELPSKQGDITYIWGIPYRIEVQEGCAVESINLLEAKSVVQVAVPEDQSRYASKYRALRAQGYYPKPALAHTMRMIHQRLLLPAACLMQDYQNYQHNQQEIDSTLSTWDFSMVTAQERWRENQDVQPFDYHHYPVALKMQERINEQRERARRVFAYDMEREDAMPQAVSWLNPVTINLKDYWRYGTKEAIEGLNRINKSLRAGQLLVDEFFVNPHQTMLSRFMRDYMHGLEGSLILGGSESFRKSAFELGGWSFCLSDDLSYDKLGRFYTEVWNSLEQQPETFFDYADATAYPGDNGYHYFVEQEIVRSRQKYLYGSLAWPEQQAQELEWYLFSASPRLMRRLPRQQGYVCWPYYHLQTVLQQKIPSFSELPNFACSWQGYGFFYHPYVYKPEERPRFSRQQLLLKETLQERGAVVYDEATQKAYLQEIVAASGLPKNFDYRENVHSSYGVNQQCKPYRLSFPRHIEPYYFDERRSHALLAWHVASYRHSVKFGPFRGEPELKKGYVWTLCAGDREIDPASVMTAYVSRHVPSPEQLDEQHYSSIAGPKRDSIQDKMNFLDNDGQILVHRLQDQERAAHMQIPRFFHESLVEPGKLIINLKGKYSEAKCAKVIRDYLENYQREVLTRMLYIIHSDPKMKAYLGEKRIHSMCLMKRKVHKWGECYYNKGHLVVNPFFVHLPLHCFIALLCHELMHLRFHDHSKSFHEGLADVCPDHELIDAETNIFKSMFRLNRH